jgi:hypothetical protein
MNRNGKEQDQDMPNRQSNMEKAEGSRESVLDNKESFEHGSGTSAMARGMGSSGSSGGSGSGSSSGKSSGAGNTRSRGGISNRSGDQERESQGRVPERGRSQSEE